MNETLCGSVRVEGFICSSEWPDVSEEMTWPVIEVLAVWISW